MLRPLERRQEADVCDGLPSQALFFGTREQIEQMRPLSTPVNTFQFGNQTITTRVYVMVPRRLANRARTSTSRPPWTSSLAAARCR